MIPRERFVGTIVKHSNTLLLEFLGEGLEHVVYQAGDPSTGLPTDSVLKFKKPHAFLEMEVLNYFLAVSDRWPSHPLRMSPADRSKRLLKEMMGHIGSPNFVVRADVLREMYEQVVSRVLREAMRRLHEIATETNTPELSWDLVVGVVRTLMRNDLGVVPLLDGHFVHIAENALTAYEFDDNERTILTLIAKLGHELAWGGTVAYNPFCNLLGLLMERFIDESETIEIVETPEFQALLTAEHIVVLRDVLRIWYCQTDDQARSLADYKRKFPRQTTEIYLKEHRIERMHKLIALGVRFFVTFAEHYIADAEFLALASAWEADPHAIAASCLRVDDLSFMIWDPYNKRAAAADPPEETQEASEQEPAARSDGPSSVVIDGAWVDIVAIQQDLRNADHLPPSVRQKIGLGHVKPGISWAEFEAAIRFDMPPFSESDELAISECDIPSGSHKSYFYGRAIASMHRVGTLPIDCGPDNIEHEVRSTTLVFIDPSDFYIRPLNPTFMAVHFHELRACYSAPPFDFGAFMAGYVHHAYTRLDPICPGYTDALLECLGANFVGTPRPRRVHVDLDRVLAHLGKRIDISAARGLFADITPTSGAVDLPELLAALATMGVSGARLSALLGPLRAVAVTGAPPGDHWLARLRSRSLAAALERSGSKRHVVLLARIAEQVADGFTDAAGWSDSWSDLPGLPVKGVVRTTLENQDMVDFIAVADRLCDVYHTISLHLARSEAHIAQSIQYAQRIWIIFQSSIGPTRSNEFRLLRLGQYDQALRNAFLAPLEGELRLHEWTLINSRWMAQGKAFVASVKSYAAGEISCPLFSLVFDIQDGLLWTIERLHDAMKQDADANIYVQALLACADLQIGNREALNKTLRYCQSRGELEYLDQFILVRYGSIEDRDEISEWCRSMMEHYGAPERDESAEAALWAAFAKIKEEYG